MKNGSIGLFEVSQQLGGGGQCLSVVIPVSPGGRLDGCLLDLKTNSDERCGKMGKGGIAATNTTE